MSTASFPVPPIAAGAPVQRRGLGRVKQHVQSAKESVWTPPIICVVVYLFVIHSFKLNIGSAAIVLGLLAVFTSGKKALGSEPMKWYAIYLAWDLLTIGMSMKMSASVTAWTDSLKILLIMFLMMNAIQNKKQHRVITLAWLAMFAFFPVRGTMLNFLTGQSSFGRYAWNFSFANFNDLAALTLIPLALSLDRLRTPDKKWIKLCAFAGLLVLPFIVLITQSRGGMLGASAFLLFLLVRSRYRLRLTMAIVAIGTLGFLFAPKTVWDRVAGMSNLTSTETLGEADSSAEQRFLILQVAATVIENNPVFGVGIGAYGIAHAKYARTNAEWDFARGRRDTHNTYLHVMAENGIVGFGLFMMIFISAWRGLSKAARAVKGSLLPEDKELTDRVQAYQAAFVGLAVCAVFGSLETTVFPFLLVSLGTATTRIYGKTNPAPIRQRGGMLNRSRMGMRPPMPQPDAMVR